jgi:hypothetical protein
MHAVALCTVPLQMTLFDVQQRITVAELSTPFIKYVVWNSDMSSVALLSKHAIVIADKKLGNAQTVHETIRYGVVAAACCQASCGCLLCMFWGVFVVLLTRSWATRRQCTRPSAMVLWRLHVFDPVVAVCCVCFRGYLWCC